MHNNCATTNCTSFEKHMSFQGVCVGRPAIYRLSAQVLLMLSLFNKPN